MSDPLIGKGEWARNQNIMKGKGRKKRLKKEIRHNFPPKKRGGGEDLQT